MNDITEIARCVAEAVLQRIRRREPIGTYRVQIEPGNVTFREALEIAAYLARLGVSHLYASPCRKARLGGANRYAIVDYGQLDPQLGTEEDYWAMVAGLHAQGLGQIIDIVPNHMSAAPGENPWWDDVLENGPSALHALHFDIDWRPVKEELRNRILLPILGGQYGQVLEAGELTLAYRNGAFFVRYCETWLPLEPRSYRAILGRRLDELKQTLASDGGEITELESILTALEHLPSPTRTDAASVAERQREKEVVKGRLRQLVERSPAVAEFVERNVQELNGQADDPHSFDALDALLDLQVYRLCHWKAADDEINYRRFFDINELAAVCTENAQVFAESHRIVFELLVRGAADGLRIDHIDGLYAPSEYLERLQDGYVSAIGASVYEQMMPPANAPEARAAWSEVEPAFREQVMRLRSADEGGLPLYVVAEKILIGDEPLPDGWLLDGTTGYEFLNLANGLAIHGPGLAELEKAYGRFVDGRTDFREAAHESKMLILRTSMASSLQLLAQQLNRISSRRRRSRDFTLNALRVALREIIACFPVYRTYIRRGEVSDRDRQVVLRAAAQAKRRNPASDAAVFDFIRDLLLLESSDEADPLVREEEWFVGRFQQLTSPVMAKGIEDTAFYRWFPLVSLNEVGGDPARGAVAVDEFHRQNGRRQQRWPRSLLASTTHDSKRSEDLRARINVLSEIPHEWRAAVNRWARWNRSRRREVDGEPAPSRNDEYLFYQCLTGVWPLEKPDAETLERLTERMQTYMNKAIHEAKTRTSWINPNAEYESAVRAFVAALLHPRPRNRFLADFEAFHERIVDWGLYGALSQTLLKLTSPGVPDIYQGQEIWDFSLVDPDNRRPVDFACRRAMLEELEREAGGAGALLPLARRLAVRPCNPRTKLFLIWRALQFRRRHPEMFRGDYVPLEVRGAAAEHVCAFGRRSPVSEGANQSAIIVIAPRWFARLASSLPDSAGAPPLGHRVWRDTRVITEPLGRSEWRSVLTGQTLSADVCELALGEVLADFPVGLLASLCED
ncbi:MAG: malto-oligosyltrehalose synthase [Thermoguttaceae bacterium]